jgi:Ferritin-like domain
MSTPKFSELLGLDTQGQSSFSRRSFFKHATVLGTGAVAGAVLSPAASAGMPQHEEIDEMPTASTLAAGDRSILIAAEIAEALAVTTYWHIIHMSPFFKRIPDDDQGYIRAALQEEMSHYALEQSVTNENSPFVEFFYPKMMFHDSQTTLNTLVTLEDAFIAAYLVGVRNFSSMALRLTSARIMGIESDHRTLARVIGPEVTPRDGGPIMFVTGAQGKSESVDPPNNNGYERTLCWTNINQAVDALTPFVDEEAAEAAGFDTSKSFKFHPFTPTLPNPLGEFFSLTGC